MNRSLPLKSAKSKPKIRTLHLVSLSFINIALFGTISNWTVVSGQGLASFAFYLFIILILFVPLALVFAELSSTWHSGGGTYEWIQRAFGSRAGFITIWLVFWQNLTWVSLPLIWIGYCWAYALNAQWINTPYFHLILSLILIWLTTFLSMKGINFIKQLTLYGLTLGFFIPALILILIGFFSLLSGHPTAVSFDFFDLKTTFTTLSHWIILPALVITFEGIEISAYHAKEVKDSAKTYPKAIFLGTLLAVCFTFLGSFAIACILPREKFSSFILLIKQISTLFKSYHIPFLFPLFAFLTGIGIYVNFANWFIGPIRGLYRVAKEGQLPPFFHQINKHNMPSTLIITQGVLMSIVFSLFILFPDVHSSYWFLISITAIWYLIAYLLLFAASIKLRYKYPAIERPFKVPGGKIGIWIVSGLGFTACLVALFFSFFLPKEALNLTSLNYALMIALGTTLFCLAPWFILLFKKASWKTDLPPEEEI